MDEKIAILTDSTCDLERETIERFGIEVLPLKIIYRDRVFLDRVDITPQEIYDSMVHEVPGTSTPSPHEATATLERLRDRGFTHVLAIHLSSGLSGTYNMVRMVAEQFQHVRTAVIDSKSLSMGLGLVVRQAARWIEERVPFDELVARTQAMVARTKGYFVVKTLEYLKRGGRINTVAAAVAGVLDLKPVISIDEHGKYFSYKKVRGRKQSLNELFEIVKRSLALGANCVAVVHGDALEEAQELLARVKELPGLIEVAFGQIGPALVVHAGPGLVGVVTTRA